MESEFYIIPQSDFTGGICESISLSYLKNKNKLESTENQKQKQDELFNMMKKSIERKSLMACAIAVIWKRIIMLSNYFRLLYINF